LAAVTATASAGLKIETSVDTVAAFVSTPCVGCVSVPPVPHSTFSASFVSNTLSISTSGIPVWAVSASPIIQCTVASFTNPAAQAVTSNVVISTRLGASTIDTLAAQAFPQISAPVNELTFTSITSGGVAGAVTNPVIVFQPKTTVPSGGTITLTMPVGYFLGSVSSITSTVTSLTATSGSATSTSTTIVLTTGGAATGTAAITMTLTGLTLGGARASVPQGFALSTSVDTTLTAGLNAGAITGIIFTSITSGGVSGAAMNPVLVFTPQNTVASGQTITLTMPAGYFLGSVASIASTVATLTATSTPAMATNTSIVLTTGGAPTGTAAITMTLTGLTLGAPRAIVTAGFALRTSADVGLSVALDSKTITAPGTAAASSAPVLVVSVFCQFVAAFIIYVAFH